MRFMKLFRRVFLAVLALTAPVLTARADPAAVIARARAHLGGEAALRAVNSVRFVGTYVSEIDGEKRSGTVDMIFQKPYYHRAVMANDLQVETTGLDDYESWMRIQDAKDPNRGQQRALLREQTKGLRTNTWETLSFFDGIEARGGKVVDLGEAVLDGVVCDKLAFEHEPGLIFHRYFEKTTGRLLLTETAQGTSKEEGSVIVNGVRFPQKIISQVKTAPRERTVTFTFEKITVNEVFPVTMFRVPSVPAPQLSMPASPLSAPAGAASRPSAAPGGALPALPSLAPKP